eukprot:SAG31_NODE_3553_length_4130_cov_2.377822_3_plen_365_part_00
MALLAQAMAHYDVPGVSDQVKTDVTARHGLSDEQFEALLAYCDPFDGIQAVVRPSVHRPHNRQSRREAVAKSKANRLRRMIDKRLHDAACSSGLGHRRSEQQLNRRQTPSSRRLSTGARGDGTGNRSDSCALDDGNGHESDADDADDIEEHFKLTSLTEAYNESDVFDGAVQEIERHEEDEEAYLIQQQELAAYEEARHHEMLASRPAPLPLPDRRRAKQDSERHAALIAGGAAAESLPGAKIPLGPPIVRNRIGRADRTRRGAGRAAASAGRIRSGVDEGLSSAVKVESSQHALAADVSKESTTVVQAGMERDRKIESASGVHVNREGALTSTTFDRGTKRELSTHKPESEANETKRRKASEK